MRVDSHYSWILNLHTRMRVLFGRIGIESGLFFAPFISLYLFTSIIKDYFLCIGRFFSVVIYMFWILWSAPYARWISIINYRWANIATRIKHTKNKWLAHMVCLQVKKKTQQENIRQIKRFVELYDCTFIAYVHGLLLFRILIVFQFISSL